MDNQATIGSLCIAVLSRASDAAGRGILTEKTRQAFATLAEKVKQCRGGGSPMLERLGSSLAERRRLSIAIEGEPVELKLGIRASAVALIDSMKSDALQGCLGVSLRKLDAMRSQLDAV
jgi:hypothetical protein